MVRRILPALLVLIAFVLGGCGDFGKVEQGRVVAYDSQKKVVTFLKDTAPRGKTPQYVTPALIFAVPTDPMEMGSEPKASLRMKLDTDKKLITMYNPQTKALDDLPFELVENHTGVNVRRQHPLVYDAAAGKPKVFPQVDVDKRTVTIYSGRQQMLTVIKLSEEDFAKYKEKEWDAGDEVRIYYHEPGKAQRMMNITRTDISRRR